MGSPTTVSAAVNSCDDDEMSSATKPTADSTTTDVELDSDTFLKVSALPSQLVLLLSSCLVPLVQRDIASREEIIVVITEPF